MRKIIILLIALVGFQSCKSKRSLYLYFKQNNENMIKWKTGEGNPFTYTYIINNDQFNFSSILFNDNFTSDTISFNDMKKRKLRNFEWLKNQIDNSAKVELITFSEVYKYIYIVEIDSLKQKAIVTKVERVFYEE